MRLQLAKETAWCLVICISLAKFSVLAFDFEESSAGRNKIEEITNETTVGDTSTNSWTETDYVQTTDPPSSTITEQNDLNATSPGVTIGSSTPRETFPPGVTNPTAGPTEVPAPTLIEAANPPGWAIGLISVMLIISLALAGVIFVRRYCLRKRREERRYLLARSQEGFFFGETNSNFNENL